MKNLNYLFLLLFTLIIIGSCAKDPDPLVISGITAVGTSFETGQTVTSDLNGATSAENVPLNAKITVTFDKELDAATATGANVKLSNPAGEASVSVSATGSNLEVVPDGEMIRGTIYTLSLQNILASDGGALGTATRTFTTEGRAPIVVPNAANQIAYWTFDGKANDETGDYPADNVVEITYGNDRYDQGNSAAYFDGDESIIEILDGDRLMAANDLTVSFWVKASSLFHLDANGNPAGHFVFGLGAFFGMQFEIPSDFSSCKLAVAYEKEDGTGTSEDLWFNGSGQDKDNGGWQGWDYVANLTGSGGVEALLKDKWAHVVCTYNATEKQGRMYINGDLMKSQDFDLWPENDAKRTIKGVTYYGNEPDVENILAFGFIKSIGSKMWETEGWGGYTFPTANHFKGALDDFRVFNVPFSADDAKALYDAEKN